MKSSDPPTTPPPLEPIGAALPLEHHAGKSIVTSDIDWKTLREASMATHESQLTPDDCNHPGCDEKTVPLTTEALLAAQEPAKELIGKRLEKFRIDDVIGHGGMGIILKAFDLELEREVAIKLLLKTHRQNPELHRQFTNEAKITGRLQHPGIIPIYETSTSPDGRPFFAMKLVKGKTLAELLQARNSPDEDLPRLLKIFEQVCHTLSYTH